MNPAYAINHEVDDDPARTMYAGIVVWREKDKTTTPLMFALQSNGQQVNITGNHDLVQQAKVFEVPLTDGLRGLGACKITFSAGSGPEPDEERGRKRHTDRPAHPSIERAPPGTDVKYVVYAVYVPLSPTIGIICHHAFRALQFDVGSKLIDIVVQANPSVPEEAFVGTISNHVEAEVLDPTLLLHYLDFDHSYYWEEYHDYQFIKLSAPLPFPSYYTPAAFRNFTVEHFQEIIPPALVSLGFALPPPETTDAGTCLEYLEMFPPDFYKKVPPTDPNLAKIKDPSKAPKAVIPSLLADRMQFIAHAVNHMCVSLGEFCDFSRIDDTDIPRGIFRAMVSLWPGMSGPVIPMRANFIEQKLFIGMASGGNKRETSNYFISVNNIGFATGYNMFVKPSFGSDVPAAAKEYLDQFSNLVETEDELVQKATDKRRREQEGEDVSEEED